jgi:hypothetical protein
MSYVADAFLAAGAGAVVSRTIKRGCSTDETAAVRPLSSRSTTDADRTVGVLAWLWADRGQVDVAELRKQAVV